MGGTWVCTILSPSPGCSLHTSLWPDTKDSLRKTAHTGKNLRLWESAHKCCIFQSNLFQGGQGTGQECRYSSSNRFERHTHTDLISKLSDESLFHLQAYNFVILESTLAALLKPPLWGNAREGCTNSSSIFHSPSKWYPLSSLHSMLLCARCSLVAIQKALRSLSKLQLM